MLANEMSYGAISSNENPLVTASTTYNSRCLALATKPAMGGGASPASAGSISRAGWAVVLATYLAYVSMYCARKPFSVVKSTVQKEVGVSSQQLANIDTALLTTYAAGQLSLGLIVRLCGGRKRALVLAFLLAGAATAAFGAANHPGSMLGAWALAGLFAAPASPLFSIVVGESVPEQVRVR